MGRNPERREYLQYLSLGLEIASGFFLPILAGYWLDNTWGTSPWLLLAGALIGIAILVGITIRIARDTGEND